MKTIINPDLLCAVASCVSSEETRPYLQGVRVLPHGDGALYVATDGHRLALGYDCEAHIAQECTIRLDWKSKDLKSGRGGQLALLIEGETAEVIHMGEAREEDPRILARMMVHYPPQSFPDWTLVLPQSGHVETSDGFNAEYLASFAAATKRAGLTDAKGIRITQSEAGGPAWVRGSDDRLAFVVMPMRWREDEGRPDFLNIKPAKSKAA